MLQCFNFNKIYIIFYYSLIMLDNLIIKKINDFVYSKPRTIQEISELIKKSWKTTESYVNKISEEQGTISMRTFRGGTKGALKIVFWNTMENTDKDNFKFRLFKQIESGRHKGDFSPLDIYQHVGKDKKSSFLLQGSEYGSKENYNNFRNLLLSAKNQIIFFSGNLSFTNMKYKDERITGVIRDLAKKGINFKILTRIEFNAVENILEMLSINKEMGRTAIEMRHAYQPLRCTIVDDDITTLKEIEIPTSEEDINKDKVNIIFEIRDKEWVGWMKKVFWDLFRTAMPCEKRLEELNDLRKKHF